MIQRRNSSEFVPQLFLESTISRTRMRFFSELHSIRRPTALPFTLDSAAEFRAGAILADNAIWSDSLQKVCLYFFPEFASARQIEMADCLEVDCPLGNV